MASNYHGSPRVMIPRRRYNGAIVQPSKIQSIKAHRTRNQTEEYLVCWTWHGKQSQTPYSWHPIHELAGDDGIMSSSKNSCLHLVQLYLTTIQGQTEVFQRERSLKRKSSDDVEFKHACRLSPFERESRASSSDRSDLSLGTVADYDTYNCELSVVDNSISVIPTTRLGIDTSNFPTRLMQQRSYRSRSNIAASKIRLQFLRGLHKNAGSKGVVLTNTRDATTPSLTFQFIDSYIYRDGVVPPDPRTMAGCGLVPTQYGQPGQTCRPNMGGNCGCEYTRSCECLEYARVSEKRLTDEQREMYEKGQLMGIPKRFPYSKGTGLLVKDYLWQRDPIYECNDNCACGPGCKSRVVQGGRQAGLEIFRTKMRGWGLRATENLAQGQFIDTYRGEVITAEEADRRETVGAKGKPSYLFSLDKFTDETGEGPRYEIDGEFYGGPTRFINHSCDPNCCIYVVSRDKNNTYLYEIAFFAMTDIRAGEELTFDYKDDDGTADPAQADENVEEDSIPCLCGSANCRKWLWK